MQECLICHKPISNRFYFCNECADQYELRKDGKYKKPTEYPDWARVLYNDEVRRRRLERKTQSGNFL